ncbi:hypothetical protein BJP34_29925 [Moorena producens PAL-8-15-08-1]|uniref:ASCH domain-containing protein n=1 Tax=Moorena producens PAL-8-15-08-1 TaxID=1458985 RepID=A0A1D8TZM3_9CYAN|nr:ASCH domain-containing protein [Moorena producens]AOX03101.1 hypothetical protein BJP34_29925 [Moorena producens PAL-8-15-08-1]
MPNVLLLSIRPKYANQLFKGTKKIELRRVRPRLVPGDIVVVYVSAPDKVLSGFFEVEDVIQDRPDILWYKVKDNAGIEKKDFNEYYEEAAVGYGICLKLIEHFEPPVTLQDLRAKWANFRPPQSYHYLTTSQFEHLKSIVQNKMEIMSEPYIN